MDDSASTGQTTATDPDLSARQCLRLTGQQAVQKARQWLKEHPAPQTREEFLKKVGQVFKGLSAQRRQRLQVHEPKTFLGVISREATELTWDTIETLLLTCYKGEELGQNPHWEDAELEKLQEQSVQWCKSRELPLIDVGSSLLCGLSEGPHGLNEETRQEILELVSQEGLIAMHQGTLCEALLADDQLTAEQLEMLAGHLYQAHRLVEKVLVHPRATTRAALRALDDLFDDSRPQDLDQSLREALSLHWYHNSGGEKVAERVLEGAQTFETFQDLMVVDSTREWQTRVIGQMLEALDHDVMLDWLEGQQELLANIPGKTFLPLLGHPEEAIRKRTARVAGYTSPEAELPEKGGRAQN